jgi:protein-disulfide isomerase
MSKATVLGIIGAAAGAAMFALGFVAGTNPAPAPQMAAGAPAADRTQIEAIVHNYLAANPEILMEMQTALESREEERQRMTQVDTIRGASDEIFNASYDGVIGNPQGSVTVVEFFDYNCGFCKRALADMEAMVETNSDLRFVLKEFPILGPDSQKAHVVSMAFRNLAPEKYGDFHRQLMSGSRAGEEAAITVATGLGVDEAALRQEMQNPQIAQAFAKTYELASRLAITGTPSYVVGDEVVFGALGQAVLEEKLKMVRATN